MSSGGLGAPPAGGGERSDSGKGSRPMDCNELVELVTAYLDGGLDPQTSARFDEHLTECDGCENYIEQFRTTVRTVGKIRDEELDPAFRNRLLDAFRNFR